MYLSHLKIHFIGIGGIGVSGLAELFYSLGATVTGSDIQSNVQIARLKSIGCCVFKGHDKKNLSNADIVIYSSAISEDNVEFAEAARCRLPLISRGEALAELMFLQRGLAVAGTHGKTTTTGLVASVFMSTFSPTVIVGGRLDIIKSTSQWGRGDWCIAESDESDGSFVKLHPEIAIITNIDNDHLSFYKNFEDLKNHFFLFAQNIPFYGSLIAYGDDLYCRGLFKNFNKKIIYYGMDSKNDFYLIKNQNTYDIYSNVNSSRVIGSFTSPIPGEHNALNSLAALLAGRQAGLSWKRAIRGLESFTGLARRFEHKGAFRKVDFYDDYAHHPTEIKSVLSSFKEKYPSRKIKVLFQPHRYTRTRDLWNDFLTCFQQAEEVYLLDVYSAGENALKGLDSRTLAGQISNTRCRYLNEGEIITTLSKELSEGDVFVTLGAGSITDWNDKIIDVFK